MSKDILAPVLQSLTDIAREICGLIKKSDDHIIAAAMQLRALKTRIENGEAGDGVKWYSWARKNLKISKSRYCKLIEIANADDPQAALEDDRKRVRLAVRQSRAKKKAAEQSREPARRELAKWADSADLSEVQFVWDQIKKGFAVNASRNAKTASGAKRIELPSYN